MFILDFSSGETCKNNIDYAKRMIDSIPPSDKAVVIKWQLFENIKPLTPLDRRVYLQARKYAKEKGYRTGSSFFDEASLAFLLQGNADFVKMAARPHLYKLLEQVPDYVPLVVSVPNYTWYSTIRQKYPKAIVLCCIANYPALAAEYENYFSHTLHYGISDHTTDWYLYKKYKPIHYEVHFCLDDSTGPDAAEFARRPDDLREVL